VKDHQVPVGDVIAEGRRAWDSIFGTVALGKFFLGFGSIGICEHAFEEAAAHLRSRMLYDKPAINMPHIKATMAQAYARLTAMKLFAYRALDYVHSSSEADRRYLLFAAVQKAKLSTEGVKVMALLSECIGAKGFESDTYFEMALRDVQLIPGLEGSTHINLGLTTQFIPRYFADPDPALIDPDSLAAGEREAGENAFLMEARTSAVQTIGFPYSLKAYGPLMSVANVRMFAKAVKAFQLHIQEREIDRTARADTPDILAMGQCLATIAYAQLVAENAVRLNVPAAVVAVMFHALASDFNVAALTLASCESDPIPPSLFRRLISVPRTTDQECDFIARQMAEMDNSDSLRSAPGANWRAG
jgi:acyl-CoA dehydrogenase